MLLSPVSQKESVASLEMLIDSICNMQIVEIIFIHNSDEGRTIRATFWYAYDIPKLPFVFSSTTPTTVHTDPSPLHHVPQTARRYLSRFVNQVAAQCLCARTGQSSRSHMQVVAFAWPNHTTPKYITLSDSRHISRLDSSFCLVFHHLLTIDCGHMKTRTHALTTFQIWQQHNLNICIHSPVEPFVNVDSMWTETKILYSGVLHMHRVYVQIRRNSFINTLCVIINP